MSICPYVCLSVTETPSLSELLLSAIEPINHWAYWPLSIEPIDHQVYQLSSLSSIEPINHQAYQALILSTIDPIDHWSYRPSSLSTIEPINHRAHQPSSLSTSGFLLRLLSLLACSIFINLFIFCCCFKHFCTIGYQAFIFLKFKNWNTLYWSILKKLGHLKFWVQFFTLRQTE